MDKYEYRVKTEQMLEYMEKRQHKKAVEIADTIDWKRVKNVSMLNTVSEIYEQNGEFVKSRDILLMAFDRSPGSRKIAYRLGILALKVNDVDEASDCYEEFVKLAPKDPNQYILKYKILKAQGSPLSEQIDALSDFKKAEYVEKWAYELAKLYHEAGMTAECLEECDDLILWFSEGKYVYQAMELKMKYKPLTPLQQEKYDEYKGVKRTVVRRPGTSVRPASKQKKAPAQPVPDVTMELTEISGAALSIDEVMAGLPDEQESIETDATRRLPTGELSAALAAMEAQNTGAEEKDEKEPAAEEHGLAQEHGFAEDHCLVEELDALEEQSAREESDADEESGSGEEPDDLEEQDFGEEESEEAQPEKYDTAKKKAISTVVTGATLEEALFNGVAMANGINLEEKKRMAQREEEIRISGQMKIEDILQEWEEKQKVNAEAIEEQRARDEERLRKERAVVEERRRAERLEAERREAEEVAKRKEEAARLEAEKKAAAEAARLEEEKKAAEEAARLEAEKKAAEEARLEAERRAAESARLEAEKRAAEEAARLEAEKKAAEAARPETKKKAAESSRKGSEKPEKRAVSKKASTGRITKKQPILSDDIRQLVEELEGRVSEAGESAFDSGEELELAETDTQGDGYQMELAFDVEEAEEGEVEAETFDEFENEFETDGFEEDEFEEDGFEEDEFEEDGFEEDEFEEDEFGEDEFEEDEFGEDEFEEDEFEEDEFEEDEFEEDEFEEDEFEEDEFEDEFDGEDFFDDELPQIRGTKNDEPLEIEEPSEEEIQKRIKKAKGSGVPFDTGFVVTGRYDLSATSEIGLKAGLTEEQKKLFSYFVPVRGMSEQIVEVLDNDRRAQREGSSRTGNLLVIGRKGSGKTVLAVDIVKAIQKQRNLKQGKVAIVTGESLNKKELSNIIQKLRGGAIIIEKAGKLNSRTIRELSMLMEKKTGEMLFVLEDQRKPLERILTAHPDFKKKFTSRLELPVFINDELVTFGQTYAKENGYKLDEMGILALYSRIDVMQREDHAVTVAEVKEIMDEAIEHSQKANVKHLARRMFGRGTDESDRIILKEEDFKH